jgi:dephospho-CoA kinase
VVGITGSMASGKSTFLQYASSKGYPVLSADDVVHSLYQKPSIQRQLKQMIHPNVIQHKHVNGSFLLEWLLQASSHVKKLEAWLHPRVINSIVNWLKKQKTIAFVEIPLLFQSHADAFIDRPFEERKKTIQSRHPNRRWEPYVLLDEKNMWKQYRPFIDCIIENEGSLEAFHQRIHDVLQSAIAASQVE